jgi:hypothetical protein
MVTQSTFGDIVVHRDHKPKKIAIRLNFNATRQAGMSQAQNRRHS